MLGKKLLLISHPQLMAFCYSSMTNIVSSTFKESYERKKRGRIWLVEYLKHLYGDRKDVSKTTNFRLGNV